MPSDGQTRQHMWDLCNQKTGRCNKYSLITISILQVICVIVTMKLITYCDYQPRYVNNAHVLKYHQFAEHSIKYGFDQRNSEK